LTGNIATVGPVNYNSFCHQKTPQSPPLRQHHDYVTADYDINTMKSNHSRPAGWFVFHRLQFELTRIITVAYRAPPFFPAPVHLRAYTALAVKAEITGRRF
jgi:hypothetical protein